MNSDNHPAHMHKTAKEIAKKAITVSASDSLSNARDLMLRNNISRVIVAAGSNPVGMVTEKGIAGYIYKESSKPLDRIRVSKAMRAPLLTIDADEDVRTCAAKMLEQDISSLVVTGKQPMLITKSDLVRYFEENFKGRYLVEHFMTRKVVKISPSHSIHTAVSVMIKNNISRVLVTKDSRLVGIVTSRDLMPVTSFAEDDLDESEGLVGVGHVMLAKDVMKNPLTIDMGKDLADAARIMVEKKISGLPVVDADGNLRGVVSKTDVVRALSKSK
jgi:CBS domain-containing protein